MTALTPTRRQEIVELRAAITPGPWEVDGYSIPRHTAEIWAGPCDRTAKCIAHEVKCDGNADFIAAAPQMVDDLLASDKAKDEVIAGLMAELKMANDQLRIANGYMEDISR